MSRERRREMVDLQHPALSMVRQCTLLAISRSSLYYRPKGTSPEDLAVMKMMRWSPSRALVNLGKTAGLSLNIAPILSN